MSLWLLLLFAVAASAADVTGRWSGFPISITLKQDGNKLTGGAGESYSDQVPITGGVIEDDIISFKMGSTEVTLHREGDDVLTGDVRMKGRTLKLVFRRVKPRDPSAPPPAFDALSVKRAEPGPNKGSSMHADPGRITCTNVDLKHYILRAYDLNDYQLSGPDWLSLERYDVIGTMPAGTPTDAVLEMLRTMLTDRFKLTTHREPKELAVYALVVDKGGLKLTLSEEPGNIRTSGGATRSLTADASFARLAAVLSDSSDRPIVDMTQTPGVFHVELEWAPEESPQPDAAPAPTLAMALKAAGLRLEPRKAPVEILVVDHAEKVPADN